MKLTDVAKEMKETMKEKGHATRTLYRGLRISLFGRTDDIVLALDRPAALVMPSELEIKIVKDAFFGDTPLKVIPGQSAEVDGIGHIVYAKRKIYMAIEK